jgi:hydrogenase small subunit
LTIERNDDLAAGRVRGAWDTTTPYKDEKGKGVNSRTDLIIVRYREADELIAARLKVPTATPVIYRLQHISTGSKVRKIQETWLPASIAADTLLAEDVKAEGDICRQLLNLGHTVATTEETIQSRTPSQDEAKTLSLEHGASVLAVDRTIFDSNGRVVAVQHIIAAADRVQLRYNQTFQGAPASPHHRITPETVATTKETGAPIHVLWINAGLSCDGESVALTAATQPSIEEIALGALPGLPQVSLHWPMLDFECGPDQGADSFIDWFWKAARGELERFMLVVEGSIPNERVSGQGFFTGFGRHPETDQPVTVNEWLDWLTPQATIVLAAGTCAAYGGIHAMVGNPTEAMGVPDYLGWDWRSKTGTPVVCVPGCPTHPDNLSETILYLLYQAAGSAPMIPLDEQLRPRWLYGATVHEGCDRAGYYEQGAFAETYDSPTCLVKLGCAGHVAKCNVPKRGWINGVGGCPNVGGICIGCTMPSFPDKFMPFMDRVQFPIPWRSGASVTDAASLVELENYGSIVRSLREFALKKFDVGPKWRNKGTR